MEISATNFDKSIGLPQEKALFFDQLTDFHDKIIKVRQPF